MQDHVGGTWPFAIASLQQKFPSNLSMVLTRASKLDSRTIVEYQADRPTSTPHRAFRANHKRGLICFKDRIHKVRAPRAERRHSHGQEKKLPDVLSSGLEALFEWHLELTLWVLSGVHGAAEPTSRICWRISI